MAAATSAFSPPIFCGRAMVTVITLKVTMSTISVTVMRFNILVCGLLIDDAIVNPDSCENKRENVLIEHFC
jgi:hypothetical protein